MTSGLLLQPVAIHNTATKGKDFMFNNSTALLKKRITIAAYCLVALCIFFAIFTPHVWARKWNMAARMAANVVKQCNEPFIDLMCDDNTKLYDTFCGTEDNSMITIFSAATDVFKTVGFLLTISVALGKIFQKFERGQEGTQMVISSIASIFIAGLIIMNIDTITGAIGDLGKELCKTIVGIKSPDEVDADAMADLAEALLKSAGGDTSGGLAWNLVTTVKLFLPATLNVIGCYAIYVVLISKFLEIGIMRIFAPLCIYDIYDEGLRSTGAVYLKRIMAGYIAIAMCAVVAYAVMLVPQCLISGGGGISRGSVFAWVTEMTNQLTSEGYQAKDHVAMFVPLVCTFTCIKAISKTDELANKVMGL